MRLYEFAGDDNLDKIIVVLKTLIGRYKSMNQPAKFNWQTLHQIFNSSGIEVAADYETISHLYDSSPQLQSLISDFSKQGVELQVPEVTGNDEVQTDPKSSQDAIDDIAAKAAPGQLDQQLKDIQG